MVAAEAVGIISAISIALTGLCALIFDKLKRSNISHVACCCMELDRELDDK
jgi:hypothetical protein